MEKETLTKLIKKKALEIGFHKIGVARAADLPRERERLLEWLEKGFHGEMLWMEREPEKRANPQILFENCQSVVSVALNYFTPHEHDDSSSKGKVSRYAWGDDYHDVVKEKLRELLNYINEICPEANGKTCVDTVPIMDKVWAQKAGLGWIGKHSNLITREYGSWVFLGEILLDVELDYDREETNDFCGSCTACLDACPTQAIVELRVVDSNLCISYATIELRAERIPGEIAENLNGWLYGCDVCQDVCPWNRFEKPTEEKRFEPREGNITADLREILEMPHEKYAERFRRSAMKRTKLKGLQRNARALLDETKEN